MKASSPLPTERPKITLFADPVSPYSWLAFEVLQRYQPLWGYDLELVPVFLGGIMAATGNTPPATLPARGAYMRKDLKRNAKLFAVPLRVMPDPFPTNTLKALRVLTLIKQEQPAALAGAWRALWHAYWCAAWHAARARGEGRDIAQEDVISDALVQAGLSREGVRGWLQAATQWPEAKAALAAATQRAIDAGAFGAPTLLVACQGGAEPNMFFGSDRFEAIATLLGKEWHGPLLRAPRL